MYDAIFKKERELRITASWIICPGSMGIWPDFKYVDRATREHSDVGDFYKLYYENWIAPRNTLFVSGAHEDHLWLNRQKQNPQILGNFWYLPNGPKTCIGPTVVGLGKVYSPKVYNTLDTPRYFKYYTKQEIEKACSAGPIDIVLSHQGPLNESFGQKKSISEGIKSILFSTRAKFLIHSGYNFSKIYGCLGTTCISLAKMEILVLNYNHTDKSICIWPQIIR